MSPFSYDEFKSENVSWDTIGQEVSGQILDIEARKGMNDKPGFVYSLLTDDGRRKVSLFVTQTDLKSKLADVAPQVGDHVRIKYVEDKNVGQPKPMKVFQVGVTSNQAAPAAPATPPPAPVDSPETTAGATQPF